MRKGFVREAVIGQAEWQAQTQGKDRALVALATVLAGILVFAGQARAEKLEQEEVKLGFIKLTDCAPLVIAKEKGFFEAEGLFVTLEAQANWKSLMDRVIDGELDGSHMLAPAPLGHTEGLLTKSEIVVPYVMSSNGAGISVSTGASRCPADCRNAPQASGAGALGGDFLRFAVSGDVAECDQRL